MVQYTPQLREQHADILRAQRRRNPQQLFNRQRERAKAALGARYDLKAFNDTVVLGGNVPLDVLALNVGEYIREARS